MFRIIIKCSRSPHNKIFLNVSKYIYIGNHYKIEGHEVQIFHFHYKSNWTLRVFFFFCVILAFLKGYIILACHYWSCLGLIPCLDDWCPFKYAGEKIHSNTRCPCTMPVTCIYLWTVCTSSIAQHRIKNCLSVITWYVCSYIGICLKLCKVYMVFSLHLSFHLIMYDYYAPGFSMMQWWKNNTLIWMVFEMIALSCRCWICK